MKKEQKTIDAQINDVNKVIEYLKTQFPKFDLEIEEVVWESFFRITERGLYNADKGVKFFSYLYSYSRGLLNRKIEKTFFKVPIENCINLDDADEENNSKTVVESNLIENFKEIENSFVDGENKLLEILKPFLENDEFLILIKVLKNVKLNKKELEIKSKTISKIKKVCLKNNKLKNKLENYKMFLIHSENC